MKNDENTPALKNAVSEWNFKILTLSTSIIRHKKHNYEIWCYSDTVRKSDTIHVNWERRDVNNKIVDFWIKIEHVS